MLESGRIISLQCFVCAWGGHELPLIGGTMVRAVCFKRCLVSVQWCEPCQYSLSNIASPISRRLQTHLFSPKARHQSDSLIDDHSHQWSCHADLISIVHRANQAPLHVDEERMHSRWYLSVAFDKPQRVPIKILSKKAVQGSKLSETRAIREGHGSRIFNLVMWKGSQGLELKLFIVVLLYCLLLAPSPPRLSPWSLPFSSCVLSNGVNATFKWDWESDFFFFLIM